MLLAGHRFFFGMTHYAVLVLRWRVDRVEFELRTLGRIDHIMSGTRRNYDRIPVLDWVFNAVNDHFSFPLLKSEELVYVLVCFFTYLFPRFKTHEHELTVLPSVQNTAEISVLVRFSLNNDYVSPQIRHLDSLQHSIPIKTYPSPDVPEISRGKGNISERVRLPDLSGKIEEA